MLVFTKFAPHPTNEPPSTLGELLYTYNLVGMNSGSITRIADVKVCYTQDYLYSVQIRLSYNGQGVFSATSENAEERIAMQCAMHCLGIEYVESKPIFQILEGLGHRLKVLGKIEQYLVIDN